MTLCDAMWRYVAMCGGVWRYVAVCGFFAFCGVIWGYVALGDLMRRSIELCDVM